MPIPTSLPGGGPARPWDAQPDDSSAETAAAGYVPGYGAPAPAETAPAAYGYPQDGYGYEAAEQGYAPTAEQVPGGYPAAPQAGYPVEQPAAPTTPQGGYYPTGEQPGWAQSGAQPVVPVVAQPVAPAPEQVGYEEPFAPTPPAPHYAGVYADALSRDAIEGAQLLLQAIGDDESSEVIINGPNEVLQKVKGQRFHVDRIQFGDADTYHRVLNEYVLKYCDTRDRIDGENVLVEGQMELPSGQVNVPPMLARVHILCPPLVQFAKVTIAKKARYEFDLAGIASKGSMTPEMAEFLSLCARGRLTTVVSGPTGAGKTTLLQAMTREYDSNDRIIVIEDTPELRLPLADVVYLTSTAAKPGVKAEDVVTTEWLVKAANRMRMDRIIVGECRGAEMAEWLIAANSGADGSATTVHADNPRRALDKILGLATKSPTSGSEPTLRREIAATVDIIVQAGLIDGRHVITHIEEISNTVRVDAGIIATQTLFEYNRATKRHEVKSRPGEDLTNILRGRGINFNANHLFRTLR